MDCFGRDGWDRSGWVGRLVVECLVVCRMDEREMGDGERR